MHLPAVWVWNNKLHLMFEKLAELLTLMPFDTFPQRGKRRKFEAVRGPGMENRLVCAAACKAFYVPGIYKY